MATQFCVQPYGIRKHKLAPRGARVFEDLDDAIAVGRSLAKNRAGVVVLSQDVDTRSGQLGKPQVISIHGRVPVSWRDVPNPTTTP